MSRANELCPVYEHHRDDQYGVHHRRRVLHILGAKAKLNFTVELAF